jgi:hypothetical protein
LKQISIALSIFCLFATSIFGRPNCCVSVTRDCHARSSVTTTTKGCSQKVSPQKARHCKNTSQSTCHTQKSAQKCSGTTDMDNSGKNKGCKTSCYRLLHPLLADSTSRSTLPNSDNTISDIIAHYILLSSAASIKTVDNDSPCRIHPSIPTTILRI